MWRVQEGVQMGRGVAEGGGVADRGCNDVETEEGLCWRCRRHAEGLFGQHSPDLSITIACTSR